MTQDIKTKGIAKALTKDQKRVLITDDQTGAETWTLLAENIRPEYIRRGEEHEYTIRIHDDGSEDLITFIKAVGSPQKPVEQRTYPNRAIIPSKPIQQADEYTPNQEMSRMAALKFAGNVYQSTGQEEDAKALAIGAVKFIETGQFQ